jgi:hypothetical protein
MFAEIVLLRLDAAVRSLSEAAPFARPRFVPFELGSALKARGARTKQV